MDRQANMQPRCRSPHANHHRMEHIKFLPPFRGAPDVSKSLNDSQRRPVLQQNQSKTILISDTDDIVTHTAVCNRSGRIERTTLAQSCPGGIDAPGYHKLQDNDQLCCHQPTSSRRRRSPALSTPRLAPESQNRTCARAVMSVRMSLNTHKVHQ
jgi:hypothetical protein